MPLCGMDHDTFRQRNQRWGYKPMTVTRWEIRVDEQKRPYGGALCDVAYVGAGARYATEASARKALVRLQLHATDETFEIVKTTSTKLFY